MAATSDAIQDPRIRFWDLVQREFKERDHLQAEKARLDDRKKKLKLTEAEKKDLERIDAVLKHLNKANRQDDFAALADPLFVATRDFLNRPEASAVLSRDVGQKRLLNHDDGVLQGEPPLFLREVALVSLILGFLAEDGAEPPRVKVNDNDSEIIGDSTDPRYGAFSEAFWPAYGEADGLLALASLVLPFLEKAGEAIADTTRARMEKSFRHAGNVDTAEFARVMRCLRAKGVTFNSVMHGGVLLEREIHLCLNKMRADTDEKPLSDIGIGLPDLNEVADYQIQAENVRLMGPILCSAMFEELKVFHVLDKLLELSQNGMLPTGRGEAGEMLYRYWKDTPNRISEGERRNIYALTLGIPGGEANGTANREFNDLWIRFVSSVSSLVRQKTADQILRANIPAAISQQQVRKAARDLALNLSSRGYGMILYLALDLQAQIKMMIKLLSDREIMAAYGARDMWQVIDQVATLELGGARNSARYRTLATCGAIITAWLANNVQRYNKATSRVIIDVDEVLSSDPATANGQATTIPTDYDLVNACELWLADTATSDERIEELSQPREAPMMTSRPVQIPAIAREMLEQAGVPGLGLGLGMRH